MQKLNKATVLVKQIPPAGKTTKKIDKTIVFPKADHCILIDNRGFLNRPNWFHQELKKSISGKICTISDNFKHIGLEDILFYQVPSRYKSNRAVYVGWASDYLLCSPKQNKNFIRILIDHPYYGENSKTMISADRTLEISRKAIQFKNGRNNVIVRRLCQGGVETVTETNCNTIAKYSQGNGLSYNKVCEEYSLTDIYIVTHPESMGLSVLECAMAGALIVAPKKYIKQRLIGKLHNIQFNQDIIWNDVVNGIDHQKARLMALQYNWENCCGNMLNCF